MTTKAMKLTQLLSAGLLSTSLLLSGCNSNDVDEVNADVDTNVNTDVNTDATNNPTAVTDTTDINSGNLTDPSIADDNKTNNASADEAISDVTNPALATGEQPSLVNNPTQAGTPEDAVKQALNTLYYGDVKQAATYYKVDIANFEQELANTQYAFQQTVEGITLTDTSYNDDKTRATIEGEIMLKGQKQPAPLSYELQKIDGKWKILG